MNHTLHESHLTQLRHSLAKLDTTKHIRTTTMPASQSSLLFLKQILIKLCALLRAFFSGFQRLALATLTNITPVFHGLLVLLIFASLFLISIETSRAPGVLVEPISIPQKLVDLGYTPEVAINRLKDGSNAYHVRPLIPLQYSTLGPTPTEVDFIVPSVDISVKSVATYFRDLMGRTDDIVSGEILFHPTENRISFRLRLGSNLIFDGFEAFTESGLEQLFLRAGYELTKRVNPYVLAIYHFTENQQQETLDIASYIARHLPGTEYHIRALSLNAMIYARNERFQDAAKEFERAAELDPTFAATYTNWCGMLTQMGDPEGAVQLCMSAIEYDSRDPQAHNNLGIALMNLQYPDLDLVLKHFETAIRLAPRDPTAYNNRGVAFMRSSNIPGAIEQYAKAVELDPSYAKAYSNWGQALKFKEDPDWLAAVDKFHMAINGDPNNASYYYNLGITLMGLEYPDYGEAIIQLTKAVELDPNNPSAYYSLGTSLMNLQDADLDGAIEQFERTTAIEPSYVAAYINWGIALVMKDEPDWDGAVNQFTIALELDSNNSLIYQNLGNALSGRGDCARAASMYDAATKIDGQDRHLTCPLLP